ncbi:hypothetical protein [Candidatus Pelagibacter sp.]|uniref:hypothetical protein n=1 Tax=Candidatus Pelagibacter sp. TaxID=2024849 RepID=UPI003F872088
MKINIKILSELFKTNKSEIKNFCSHLVKKKIIFNYIKGEERDKVLVDILKRIRLDSQIIAGKGRTEKWHNGWGEALSLYKKSNSLTPKFYTARENKYFRLGGELIKSRSPNFEVEMVNIYRNWYFRKYLKNVENIYEFGAGTGHNMVELSKIFPNKKLYASDFVSTSVDLLKLVSKKKKLNMRCFQFDMIKPNKKLEIKNNSAIYTSGALEQLSGKIYDFINFVIAKKPKIVLHVEPAPQFYDTSKLVDFTADFFQRKRGYTDNLLEYLKKLEKKNKIKILKKMKSPFGSLMIEGYNFIAWRPK